MMFLRYRYSNCYLPPLYRVSELNTTEAERQQALSKLESLFDFIVPLISFLLSIWHFAILIQSYNGNEFLEGMAGQPRFLDNVLGKAFT